MLLVFVLLMQTGIYFQEDKKNQVLLFLCLIVIFTVSHSINRNTLDLKYF